MDTAPPPWALSQFTHLLVPATEQSQAASLPALGEGGLGEMKIPTE
jgi:hypothetical protein